MAAGEFDLLDRMFWKVVEHYRTLSETAMRKNGLTHLAPGDVRALDRLGRVRSDRITSLARKLNLTVGTLSPTIDRLVKKGLVSRERLEEDRRVVEVRLTQYGQEIFTDLETVKVGLAERVFSRLNETERQHLQEILDKLLVGWDETAETN